MKLIESYGLVAGQKITKPEIMDKFYPLPFNKYICIQPFSKASKNYSYWNEVLELIYPVLSQNGYNIVQIGAKDEQPLPFCHHTQGTTTLLQANYLVKNCELLLSTDSFCAHLAGIHDKKLVSIYSNNYISAVSPYFGSSSNQILLEPNRENLKPSFSFEDPLKQIDSIKPEKIARSVCKLLNLPFSFDYKTLFFGSFYNSKLIETLPNQLIDPSQFNIDSVIVRMDFLHNENILFQQLSRSLCSIVTKQPIDIEQLRKYKKNIKELVYVIDKNHDVEFAKNVRSLGIKFTLFTRENEEWLNTIKLDYLDIGLILRKDIPKLEDIKELKEINPNNLFFKTGKFLLSEGKIYPSYSYFLVEKSVPNFEPTILPFLNNQDSFSELEHFYLLEKTN